MSTTRTNQFAGTCQRCAVHLEVGEGQIYRRPPFDRGPWLVKCLDEQACAGRLKVEKDAKKAAAKAAGAERLAAAEARFAEAVASLDQPLTEQERGRMSQSALRLRTDARRYVENMDLPAKVTDGRGAELARRKRPGGGYRVTVTEPKYSETFDHDTLGEAISMQVGWVARVDEELAREVRNEALRAYGATVGPVPEWTRVGPVLVHLAQERRDSWKVEICELSGKFRSGRFERSAEAAWGMAAILIRTIRAARPATVDEAQRINMWQAEREILGLPEEARR